MARQVKPHYWEYGYQTPEERKKYGIGPIFENAAKCHSCGDYIRSNNRHDFKYCSCGNVAVDGGSWYAKRVFKDVATFDNIIVEYDDDGIQESDTTKSL